MKIFKLFIMISIFILPAAFSQELKDIKVPSGMKLKKLGNGYYTVVSEEAAGPSADKDKVELKKVGSINLLVPKGMQVSTKGSLVTVENKNEYLARRLSDMEARFSELETEHRTLKKTIKNLKESTNSNIVKKDINDLKQTRSTSIVVAK